MRWRRYGPPAGVCRDGQEYGAVRSWQERAAPGSSRTLRTFREEYEEHIVDKKCKAKVCQAMRRFMINPEYCKGCGKCAKNCPVGAITGVRKECYHIDPNICIKCGACKDNCAFDASVYRGIGRRREHGYNDN